MAEEDEAWRRGTQSGNGKNSHDDGVFTVLRMQRNLGKNPWKSGAEGCYFLERCEVQGRGAGMYLQLGVRRRPSHIVELPCFYTAYSAAVDIELAGSQPALSPPHEPSEPWRWRPTTLAHANAPWAWQQGPRKKIPLG